MTIVALCEFFLSFSARCDMNPFINHQRNRAAKARIGPCWVSEWSCLPGMLPNLVTFSSVCRFVYKKSMEGLQHIRTLHMVCLWLLVWLLIYFDLTFDLPLTFGLAFDLPFDLTLNLPLTLGVTFDLTFGLPLTFAVTFVSTFFQLYFVLVVSIWVLVLEVFFIS